VCGSSHTWDGRQISPAEPNLDWWLSRPLWIVLPFIATLPFLTVYRRTSEPAPRPDLEGATS
jgi:hypothetical protein